MFTYRGANRTSSCSLSFPVIAAATTLSVAVAGIAYASYLLRNRQSTSRTSKDAAMPGSSSGRDNAIPSRSAACSGQEVSVHCSATLALGFIIGGSLLGLIADPCAFNFSWPGSRRVPQVVSFPQVVRTER